MYPGQTEIRCRIPRIDFQRIFGQLQCFFVALWCEFQSLSPASLNQLVCAQIFGRPVQQAVVLGQIDVLFQSRDNFSGVFILQSKDIFHVPIIGFHPDRVPDSCINQLRSNPQLVPGFLQVAFKNVADAKFFSDIANIGCLAFVKEAGISRDYKNSEKRDSLEMISSLIASLR